MMGALVSPPQVSLAAPQPRRVRCQALKPKEGSARRILRDGALQAPRSSARPTRRLAAASPPPAPAAAAVNQPAPGGNLSLLALSEFLRAELAINDSMELTRVMDVATNQNSVFGARRGKGPSNPAARKVTVEEARAVVAFLNELGLDRAAAAAAVVAFPPVLCYDVEARLRPLTAFLEAGAGLERARLAAVLARRPALLGLQPDQIERIVGYLRAVETPEETLLELLASTL
jgi:hypothetical protein